MKRSGNSSKGFVRLSWDRRLVDDPLEPVHAWLVAAKRHPAIAAAAAGGAPWRRPTLNRLYVAACLDTDVARTVPSARPPDRGRRDRGAGARHARELAELIEACDETIPFEVCEALAPLVVQLPTFDERLLGSIAASQSLRSKTKRPAD